MVAVFDYVARSFLLPVLGIQAPVNLALTALVAVIVFMIPSVLQGSARYIGALTFGFFITVLSILIGVVPASLIPAITSLIYWGVIAILVAYVSPRAKAIL